MIKRVYCKQDYKGFEKGEIYETVREDDDYSGELGIFHSNQNCKTLEIAVINGEFAVKYQKYFKLIRRCYEEYQCKGEYGLLIDSIGM